MAETEATIPEPVSEAAAEPAPEAATPEPPVEPKRGRGRPAGSKDKAPRTVKPKVRAEPIPQPAEPKAATKPKPVAAVEAPPPPVAEERPPVVEEAAPHTPEPPSPRTLYRQTSAHLLNSRDVMNSQKRAQAAERYTARLHALPVV